MCEKFAKFRNLSWHGTGSALEWKEPPPHLTWIFLIHPESVLAIQPINTTTTTTTTTTTNTTTTTTATTATSTTTTWFIDSYIHRFFHFWRARPSLRSGLGVARNTDTSNTTVTSNTIRIQLARWAALSCFELLWVAWSCFELIWAAWMCLELLWAAWAAVIWNAMNL